MFTVIAIPGNTVATLTYSVVTAATRYVVTLTAAGQAVPAVTLERTSTDPRVVTVPGLANGTQYTVNVDAYSAAVRIDRAETVVTPVGTATAGIIAAALDLTDGWAFSSADALIRRALAGATSTGSRWRYDFLRAQAVAAATDAARLDDQVAELVQLDVAKVTSAEQILTPHLISAINNLGALADVVHNVPVPELGEPVAKLSEAISTVALLERLITWLSNESQLGFWVGLFAALIDDIAAGQIGLPRARHHVREQFDGGALGTAVVDMLGYAQAEVLAAIADVGTPLRAAVAEVMSEVAGGLEALFESFDDALLVPTGTGSPADPLTQMAQKLSGIVDALLNRLRDAVSESLSNTGTAGAAAGLFEAIVVTYLVLPILSAVAIAVAGGPISAAALAAVVTLAGQELIHLVTRWLAGPIAARLDEVRAKVAEATQQLQEAVTAAVPTSLPVSTTGPTLRLLAGQLGNLRDLLPDELLHEAAKLVEEARDVLLRTATDLALGAEQALGMEHGTAFDLVDFEYVTSVRTAPRLPGGTGNGRYASAGLLRDLGRLDQARTQLLDGKDLLVTQRLSLFELLGGNGSPESAVDKGLFPRLLAGEHVVVRLTEENVIDRSHPGLYRVLIADLKVSGVFANLSGELLRVVNVPVHVTHLGTSRTRVRRGSNPFAPDLPLPRHRRPPGDPMSFPHESRYAEASSRTAKWGSAYLAEDRDPRVESLGFATLVRELPPETAVFNLFPDDTRVLTASGRGGEPVTVPFGTRDSEQYRPFENRGIEGELLVRIPTAVQAEMLADMPASLLGGAGKPPLLLDLVFETTLRACYDDDLAAAVRAAQGQRREVMKLAGAAVTPGMQFARAVPVRLNGESERRTVHISLRAHRDETLRMWQAFVQAYYAKNNALPTTGADWAAVEGTVPLRQDDAFQPLPLTPDSNQNRMPLFEIGFGRTTPPPGTSDAALAALVDRARRVTVTPDMLGIAEDLVVGAGAESWGGIAGISVSVVPMPSTATTFGKRPRTIPPALDTATRATEAAVCALDRGLHVVAQANGQPWETRLAVDEWQPLKAAGSTWRPEGLSGYSSVEIDGEVHVCAVGSRKIWHCVRRRDGSWSQWADVIAQRPTTRYGDYRCVAVAESDGELHVAAGAEIASETNPAVKFALVHTVRRRDGTWSGIGDASSFAGNAYFNAINDVDCAESGGVLHVALVDGHGNAYHTIRHRSGEWQFMRNVNAAIGVPAGTLRMVGVAGLGASASVVAVTDAGRLIQTYWRAGWWEMHRDVTQALGHPGPYIAVDCAVATDGLHLVALGTDGRVYHAPPLGRSWAPRVDVFEATRHEVVLTDPLAGKLRLGVGGKLAARLPGFTTAATPARLTVGPGGSSASSVRFVDLFKGAAADRISLTLPKPEEAPIYDVVVSLTYVVPVRTMEVVPS